MQINRRSLLQAIAALPVMGLAASAEQPDRPLTAQDEFPIRGVYLDSAYTHPLGRTALNAGRAYMDERHENAARRWPGQNSRDAAVAAFARLIHAEPSEVAVVPSTMQGENQVVQAIGLDLGRGVVTDSLHYDASLVMYGELARKGVPVNVVETRNGCIDLENVARAITPTTRLIAISLISSISGFQYDLNELCNIAHQRGVMVYADIIQAVGATPIDVKQSGVDFCCAGTYKFLMGDFGVAFLYVRPDRLHELRRTLYGWRQIAASEQRRTRFDNAPDGLGSWSLRNDTASVFEISTPAWGPLAIAAASMNYIESLGVGAIEQHRLPLLLRLRAGMGQRGFETMTPETSRGPLACFARKDIERKLRPELERAGITVSVYPNYLRVSLSIFNTLSDIEALLSAVDRAFLHKSTA